MSNEMIQNDIQKLDELKSLCDETEIKVVGEQNDSNLLSVLDEEYKLTKKVKSEILKLVEGTKKGKSISKSEENRLKEILFGHCMICGVNYTEKDSDEFVGFDTLRHRISQKKNQLNRKLK